jgi:hypothetical protein
MTAGTQVSRSISLIPSPRDKFMTADRRAAPKNQRHLVGGPAAVFFELRSYLIVRAQFTDS